MMKKLAVLVFLLALPASFAKAGDGNTFHWTRLDLGSECSGYPEVYKDILKFGMSVSSIDADPNERFVRISDDRIFESPFLFLACRNAPHGLTDDEVRRLRTHLTSGGTLWIENLSGQSSSSFDRWVKNTARNIFPGEEVKILPKDHAVYRSFFLIKSPAGRRKVADYMEGVDWGSRTVLVYSKNDLPGAWPLDALGRPLYPCVPGGEPQRLQAQLQSFNIIMYALTGTYKQDAVHQPFILDKLRRRGNE
ncbi:MAG: DUF4159 domain-containing protein [Elusimicrobiaceae bacterium]